MIWRHKTGSVHEVAGSTRRQRSSFLLSAFALVMVPLMTSAGCTSTHSSPEIVSLESRDRVIAHGDSVVIECVAIEGDGGELAYEWHSDRGILNGHAGTYGWTAPWEEGVARITVTVTDRAGDTVSESIAIVVKKNTPPEIIDVTSDHQWIPAAGTVTLNCEAEDVDGDALSYNWSAQCGELLGQGPSVTWRAPQDERECTITVVVDDGYEGQDKASITLAVSETEPLLITSLGVAALDDPEGFLAKGSRYTVYRGESVLIQAIVNRPEEVVSYEWTDGGPVTTFPVVTRRIEFDGGPARIRWKAPEGRREYTITVSVTGQGEESARRSVTISVETCLPCM